MTQIGQKPIAGFLMSEQNSWELPMREVISLFPVWGISHNCKLLVGDYGLYGKYTRNFNNERYCYGNLGIYRQTPVFLFLTRHTCHGKGE